MEVDEVLKLLGGYRKFQICVYLALCFVYMRGAWPVFATMFMAGDPGHQCKLSHMSLDNSSIPENATFGGKKLFQDHNTSGKHLWEVKECEVMFFHSDGNVTEKCLEGWDYGTEFKSTILMEWNLVCDKDFLVQLEQTIYMMGSACGALVLTPLADRFGRKWTLLICLWLQAVFGIGLAFVDGFVVFFIIRYFIGFLNMSIALIAYVIITEVFPSTHRAKPSVAINCSWSVGIVLLSLLGYFIRSWRYLEIAIFIPNIITLSYIWFFPESLTWLVAKGKTQQAEKLIKRIERINKLSLSSNLVVNSYCKTGQNESLTDSQSSPMDDIDPIETSPNGVMELSDNPVTLTTHSGPVETSPGIVSQSNQNICVCDSSTINPAAQIGNELEVVGDTAKHCSMLDIFKTPQILYYMLITFYLWFVNSLSYFGIMFSTPILHGNRYLNLALSGAVEIVACIICMFALDKFGRKKPMIVFLFLCGVMNISTLFVPQKTASGINLGPVIVTLAMVGKFGITGSYSTVYLYSTEIFPTAIRNQAVGLSSFFENLGSVAAPFIVYGATTITHLPLFVFGVLTIVGGFLACFLPETHRQPLPGTIEEVKNFDLWNPKSLTSLASTE